MPKHGDIAVSSLLGNQEATMNSAVTRSVAIFLDQLGEKYNQQLLLSDYANDETFKTLFVERLRQAVEKYKVQFDEGMNRLCSNSFRTITDLPIRYCW